MTKTCDILEIMEMLPHRYPFLLVDRIIDLVPGEKVVGLKNVTVNEPFFQGHFPGAPIMPGVLIVEAMAQTGGILAIASTPEEERGRLIYFMGIDKVRFRKPVVSGDQLIIEMSLIRHRTKMTKMGGVVTVDGNRVAEAELMAAWEK